MSVFDLLRGFFGPPGGHYRGEGRRDPFFDGMTHDDDDDEDDDDEFHYDGYREEHQDHFDDAWRFGLSFGPSGMRIEEPAAFGQVFKEIEEIITQLGCWDAQPGARDFGFPSIMPPRVQDRPDRNGKSSSGNTLRDFMLKSPDDPPPRPHAGPSREPRNDSTPPAGSPNFPSSPFHGWTPFSKFNDIWRQGAVQQRSPEGERREDGDLDSAVSSGGLDQILTPPAQPPSRPRTRSFFQSVTVTKVVKPDGSVEEKRTVRDGQGNEETTVTCSRGPEGSGGPEQSDNTGAPVMPGAPRSFSDLRDDSFFSSFFGGFK